MWQMRVDPWVGKIPEVGHGTHSSVLAWRISWTEESGGLQSMGLQSVGHDWVTKCTHVFKAGQFYFWFFFTLSLAVRWNSVYLLKYPVTTWSETLHCRVWSRSVVSDSLLDSRPSGSSIRGVFQASILEWIAFPSRGDLPSPGLNLGFPHCRQMLYPLSHWGSPSMISRSPREVLRSNLLLLSLIHAHSHEKKHPLLYPHYRMLQLHLTTLSSAEQFPVGLWRSVLTVLVLGLTEKFVLSLWGGGPG